ncbi:MAG: translation elongation factor Ts [Coriobacteriia bacterium]|nr:translation elongation factor Ts [Coriobacteriia bacterium]
MRTSSSRYELGSDAGAVTVYIHGVGNIGVMIEIAASSAEAASSAAFAALSKDVAMQITAAAPYAVSREGVPTDIVEHEKSIFKAQAAESGKPEQIQDKIAEGRLEKFFKEVALLEQQFVKDQDITVRQHLERTAKELGCEITVIRFERMVLGETDSSDV